MLLAATTRNGGDEGTTNVAYQQDIANARSARSKRGAPFSHVDRASTPSPKHRKRNHQAGTTTEASTDRDANTRA